ncbi:g6247 [Coccomyxa elongata]
MAFNFGGTPTSTPASGFSFGAASTPATPQFGASNPVFGAASTPGLFGASSSAFSFASASAPPQSQPAATTSLFAGFSAPAFGAASSSAFGFGGASTPAFGGTAASTPAFSFNTAPSAPAFGTPGSAPAPFSGFGGAASSPFGTTSIFGGQPMQQPQTQMAPATFASGLPPQPDLAAIKELEAIREAYTAAPDNPRYRFHHLFLNVAPNPAACQKPQVVDELRWREAMQRAGGPNNLQHLWPVLAHGTKDLIARKDAQDAAIREHTERLSAAAQAARQLVRKQDTVLKERVEQVRKKHRELSLQLLRVMRKVDLLEGRFASAMGYWSSQQKGAAADLAGQLSQLEAQVAPGASGGLEERVEALAAGARMQAGGKAGTSSDLAGMQARLDPASLEQVFAVLKGHAEALAKLQDVLRRDDRDLAILSQAKADSDSAMDMTLVPTYS